MVKQYRRANLQISKASHLAGARLYLLLLPLFSSPCQEHLAQQSNSQVRNSNPRPCESEGIFREVWMQQRWKEFFKVIGGIFWLGRAADIVPDTVPTGLLKGMDRILMWVKVSCVLVRKRQNRTNGSRKERRWRGGSLRKVHPNLYKWTAHILVSSHEDIS